LCTNFAFFERSAAGIVVGILEQIRLDRNEPIHCLDSTRVVEMDIAFIVNIGRYTKTKEHRRNMISIATFEALVAEQRDSLVLVELLGFGKQIVEIRRVAR
jgi:hypothetical protein